MGKKVHSVTKLSAVSKRHVINSILNCILIDNLFECLYGAATLSLDPKTNLFWQVTPIHCSPDSLQHAHTLEVCGSSLGHPLIYIQTPFSSNSILCLAFILSPFFPCPCSLFSPNSPLSLLNTPFSKKSAQNQPAFPVVPATRRGELTGHVCVSKVTKSGHDKVFLDE